MNSVAPQILEIGAATALGAAAGYLGSLMISRRMALAGDALGHVALPGLGLALTLGFDPTLGAFAFILLGTLLVWRLGKWTELSEETRIGVIFVASLSLGFILVPKPELLESLFGDVSQLHGFRAILAIAAAALVTWTGRAVYSDLVLFSLSPELAEVEGVRPALLQLKYLASLALLVSVGIFLTGTLLVGALVIVPAATARLFSRDRAGYVRRSAGFGALSCLLGSLLARVSALPPGATIVLVSVFGFVAVLIVQRSKA